MALDCLGWAHVTFGTQEFEWEFIVVDIGADEGILGNNFAMRHAIIWSVHMVWCICLTRTDRSRRY